MSAPELVPYIEVLLLVFIAGFMMRENLARLLGKMGFRRAEEAKPQGDRVEQIARLVKDMHPEICDDDGKLQSLHKMHDRYLPDGESIQHEVTGQRELSWHNYTVVHQNKQLQKALVTFATRIEELTAQTARSADAVTAAVEQLLEGGAR